MNQQSLDLQQKLLAPALPLFKPDIPTKNTQLVLVETRVFEDALINADLMVAVLPLTDGAVLCVSDVENFR